MATPADASTPTDEDVIGSEPAVAPVESQEAPPPADAQTGAAPAELPDNFAGLADLAKEIEPRLKEGDAIPRGPDGKFLPREVTREGQTGAAPAAAQTGPTGPAKAALASEGASGATVEQTGATGATGPAPATGRDADLDTSKLNPRMHESTRKVIDGYAQKAREARDRVDALQREHSTLTGKIKELEDRLKTIKAPKEMEDELATLRTRVRELDISKDPELQSRYDARIKKNSEAALGLLKDFSIFKVAPKDGGELRDMSEAEKKALTTEIERAGFGIRGMARYISALEKAGEYEAAERLRRYASENDSLTQEKEEEIATWTKDYEGFQAQKTREAEEQRNAYLQTVKTAGETFLQQDLGELVKQFPYLNRPPAPQASDSPEVAAAKQKALDEYDAAAKTLEERVKTFNVEGQPPEKAAEAYGRLQSSAIQAVILKEHVLPRLLKESGAAAARVKELEAEVAKFRKAGTINRAHAAAITTPTQQGRAPSSDLSLEAAAKQIASEMGIKVD